MSQTDNNEFSTQKITPQLISHVVDALRNKQFGSVEIYIQNFKVVQITERKITKVTTSTKILRKTPIGGNGHSNAAIQKSQNS